MRSGSGAPVVTILFVFLFGCLALGVECRSLLLEDGGRGSKSYYPLTTRPCHNDAGSVNSTMDDESELTLVFCTYKGVLQCVGEEPCYCCQSQQEPQCAQSASAGPSALSAIPTAHLKWRRKAGRRRCIYRSMIKTLKSSK
ncbi:hypothetical protein PVAP13_1NG064300 [Panicum virgatum]|uniref:Uncharacterized protein n=1 Tax=Panicum virgatum TaxID=38727 RepID=A0A8T0WGR6_PANVG|nr:hypothetical protein PVAP13_1NG064300 [Panicum virgatum]